MNSSLKAAHGILKPEFGALEVLAAKSVCQFPGSCTYAPDFYSRATATVQTAQFGYLHNVESGPSLTAGKH